MKRIITILLVLISLLFIGSCSKVRIEQARQLSQAEIDEHNKTIKPGDDGPGDDEPGDDQPGGDNTPSWPPVPARDYYYVSVAGSGSKDGSTSANALDLATFKVLVSTVEVSDTDPDSQEKSDTRAAAMDGVTFHFAAGTYVLGSPEALYGLKLEYTGYTKKVRILFEGEDDAVLSGDDKYRVLTLGNQIDLTIRGMKVANGYNALESGAGISVEAGTTGEASLSLDRTIFSGNKTTAEQSGGALRCAKGKITASECVFDESNYSRNGASIMTNNAAAEVQFTACTFKSHSANTGGAVNNSKGKQTFVNCDFTGCYTEGGIGGAIHANGEGCEVNLRGCRFTSCKALTNSPMSTSTSKAGGIISTEQARVDIDKCVFEDCEGATAALIYMKSGSGQSAQTGGFLTCNNTVFKNNRGADRGLIQINGSKSNTQASIAFFNNCVFYGNSMRTNQWGFILHGGNPGMACFNNCTIYGNTRQEAGGNGVILNSDGLIAFTNSTLIGSGDLAAVRNTDSSNEVSVLLGNSIIVNTSTDANSSVADGDPDGKNNMRCPFYAYNNIMGPKIDLTKIQTCTAQDNILDATAASLGGGSWDAANNLYTWNGPASAFPKMAAADFENVLKTGLSIKPGAFNPYIGNKSLGEFFHEWLTEIGAVGKDAAGADRGASWWPGAYQGESQPGGQGGSQGSLEDMDEIVIH